MGNELISLIPLANGSLFELNDSTKVTLWIGIAVYILAVLVIGILCGRKVKNVGDFIVAGRRLPLWMATATLLATWFGAGSSMGVAATVYSGNIRDVISDPFGASISLVLAGMLVVGVLRRMRHMTVTDIIQAKFGRSAGIYASLWLIPVYVGWLGAQVLGLGVLLNLLTGVNMFYAQLIGAAVVLIYTVSGGMWAVTLTDVVQVGLIILGLLLIVPGAIHYAGGFDVVFGNPANDYSLLPPPEMRGSFDNWVNYTGSWIIMGLGCMVGQDLLQRSLASRSDKIAVSSSVMAGFFYMIIAIIPITIGLAAKILLPKWGIDVNTMGGDLENQVLPRVAVGVLGSIHPILLTLFLSALISAIMSSADSSLLAATSLLVHNIFLPMRPKTSDKTTLLLTRVFTILVLFIATFLAMKVKSIYALMINCWASQLVVVFIPVIAAIYCPKASRNTIWCTMLVSTVVWIMYMFIGSLGVDGAFTDILESDQFQFALTNGAVYGFFAGILAFITCYIGERIPDLIMPDLASAVEEAQAEHEADHPQE